MFIDGVQHTFGFFYSGTVQGPWSIRQCLSFYVSLSTAVWAKGESKKVTDPVAAAK